MRKKRDEALTFELAQELVTLPARVAEQLGQLRTPGAKLASLGYGHSDPDRERRPSQLLVRLCKAARALVRVQVGQGLFAVTLTFERPPLA